MNERFSQKKDLHTYFCYYLFQNIIYSFKYPIIIFVVLMAISWTCAIVTDKINIMLFKS